MQGAREYATLFQTGQHGRLYLVSSSHARGKTFRIFVLPEGEDAKPNGPHNALLNGDAVEVFGIVGGQPGWTETYGWLYAGRWQEDFAALVDARKAELAAAANGKAATLLQREEEEAARVHALLATY